MRRKYENEILCNERNIIEITIMTHKSRQALFNHITILGPTISVATIIPQLP